jgi:signal transduction histidine kinase
MSARIGPFAPQGQPVHPKILGQISQTYIFQRTPYQPLSRISSFVFNGFNQGDILATGMPKLSTGKSDMRRITKTWLLTLGVAIFLTLIFALLALFLYGRTEQAVVKAHSRDQQLLARLAATALRQRLDAQLHTVDALAAALQSVPTTQRPRLLRESVAEASTANLLLVFPDGSVDLPQPVRDPVAIEAAVAPWVGFEEPVLTNPFPSTSDDAEIILLAPLITEGKVAAQAGAIFPFAPLVKTLFAGGNGAEHLSVDLLDERGIVLANTHHPEMLGRQIPPAGGACLPCHTSFDLERRMMRGETDVVRLEMANNHQSLLAFTPVSVPGRRWSLALSEPYSSVIADTRKGFRAISLLLAFSLLVGIVATALMAQTLTLRRRAEERARLAERRAALERQMLHNQQLAAMGKMTSQIAHEINTPLAALGLNVSYLQTEVRRRLGKTSPEIDEASRAIAEEIDRLKRVVNDYLRFSRLPEPVLIQASLRESVESLVEFLEVEARERAIQLEATLGSDPAVVLLDSDLFRQAFLNLVRNSFEAMPAGGFLRVDLSGTPDEVVLRLSDTGSGIPPTVLPRIFDPFFTTKKDGTGLGLAHVRRVVEQHGGSIECESTPGKGTTFTLRLPAQPAAETFPELSLAEKGR